MAALTPSPSKICYICHQTKPLDAFYRNRSTKDGRMPSCAECNRRLRNTPEAKAKQKVYSASHYERNLERIKVRSKAYATTPQRQVILKAYRKTYRPKAREAERRYWQNNERCRIRRSLCQRLKRYLDRGAKAGKLTTLIGCSYEHFVSHIESLWKPGMNWTNRGFGHGKWVLDHILPCASFDLTDAEQQLKCFHYSNLQPLWYEENAAKSDYFTLDGKLIRARDLPSSHVFS